MSMANLTGARVRAIITYYRVKYTDAAQRLDVLRADYLLAFEESEKRGGKTLINSGADGASSGWSVGLSMDERLDAMTQALNSFEGRTSNRGKVCL